MGILGSSPKPIASLSSTLLARKGQAKPAMRPQGFGGFGAMPGHDLTQDDLGWNDMGHDAPSPVELAPVALAPVASAPIPPVLVQREALEEEIAQAATPDPEPIAAEPKHDLAPRPAPKPISLATATRIGRETKAKNARAAFTLRLDTDRHLRLRLASALQNQSAQILMTAALDAFLQTLPEVEALAIQLPPRVK